ncbi:MAG: GDP-L-fucose synthase [Nitrospirae bacterium]|nr:GDP-L-fucose synthase [Nitrospirota bacterium]
MNKDSKIYIAGHRGLVGSAILRKLKEKGYRNIVTKTSKQLDLRNQSHTERFFKKEKPEFVFLAAAKVGGIIANNTYRADFIYDNIMIASNIIHAAYKYGVKKLLNLGSSCIYPKYAPQPMKEEYLLTGQLEPTNEPYAIAKISAIKLCRYFNEQYGTDFISIMPTNLYGPKDNFNLETSHVLPAMIRKFYLAKLFSENRFNLIKENFLKYGNNEIIIGGSRFEINKDTPEDKVLEVLKYYGIYQDTVHGSGKMVIKLWGSGEPYREFLYVDDLAEASIFLMERYSFKDVGEFINIGTGEDITIKDLANLIKDIVGFEGIILWDTTKPDGTPRKLLDVSRIQLLGWKPSISLEEGIRKTYKWYLS